MAISFAFSLALSALACSGPLESDGITRESAPRTSAADSDLPSPDAGTPAVEAPAPVQADAGAVDAVSPPLPLPPDVSAPDASANDAAATSGNDMRCGAPPYQVIRLSARDIMDPDKRNEIPGVGVTLKHCPEQTFALKRNSTVLQVTAGAETWIRFDAPGYLPWVEGELRIPSTQMPPIEATMVPLPFVKSLVPAWQPDVPLVYVEVRVGRAGGLEPCRSVAGVTLAVKDQPQALVLYRGKGANAGFLNVPGTTEEGVAIIANLPATSAVEILASKPGCLYLPTIGDANSDELLPLVRAPLFPSALTHQTLNPVR